LHSTQYCVKYSEIALKLASVFSASPVHSQGKNPYILEGTEAFTLIVTFLLHYYYIYPEIKEFPLFWNCYQKYFYINKYFITNNCKCNLQCKDSISYRSCEFFTPKMARIVYILDLKLTTSLYQASFRTDLAILNPMVLITTHF
jgi:hypothetical protein